MREFWDQRYAEADYAYGTVPNHFLVAELGRLAPGRLLLPAEGEGRNAVWAAEQGWQVDAYDFSEAGREKCLKLARERGVTVRYDLANHLDASYGAAEYDALGLVFSHVHETHRRSVHRRLAAALRPGGTLIMEAFTKAQLARGTGGPRSLDMLYDPADLPEDFAELNLRQCEPQVIELREGRYHDGVADVVRLVAVR